MSVYAPAGSTVSVTNGSVITINGTNSTVYVLPGSVLSVPSNATGAANNLVTTGQPTSGSTPQGTVTATLIAGTSTLAPMSAIDGNGSSAAFVVAGAMTTDAAGNVYVADRNIVRKVTPGGTVTTLGANAPLNWVGIAMDKSGNFFGASADETFAGSTASWTASIEELSASGNVTRFSTNYARAEGANGNQSGSIAMDSAGNLFIANYGSHRIDKISSTGVYSVFAGSGTAARTDGVGAAASFNGPAWVGFDASGKLWVNDIDSVRKVTADGTVSTITPVQPRFFTGDSASAVDPSGNVYVAGDFKIFRVDRMGNLTSYPLPNSLYIQSLGADSTGNVYAGTGHSSPSQVWKLSFN